ncbi:TPA: DUF4752 family protein [Raoultella ornithinolytica]
MDAFAKYTLVDWVIILQVVLIWFYMAHQTGRWIVGAALRRGWRWWNKRDQKTLAWDSFHKAFGIDSIKPGERMIITTESGMTITIRKPQEVNHG